MKWDDLRGQRFSPEEIRQVDREAAGELCPWYVSAHAVRRYIEETRSSLSFDDASDALIEYCARAWARYRDGERRPTISGTGAYVYQGPGPWRLPLIVVMGRRPEGEKPQLVDVGRARRSGDKRNTPSAQRRRARPRNPGGES